MGNTGQGPRGSFGEPRERTTPVVQPPPTRSSSLHNPAPARRAPSQPPVNAPAPLGTPHQRGIEVAPDAPRKQALNPDDIIIPPPPKDFEEIAYLPVKALPSGGLAYPPGSTISYRPYVFGELKTASAKEGLPFGIMSEILIKGMKASFDILDLTFYDFLYIALLRKLSTIQDTKVNVTHICKNEKCQARNIYTIDVSANNCEIEFFEVEFPELPITVTLVDGRELQFKPLTLGQFMRLEQAGLERDSVALLAMQCTNLPFPEARQIIYWGSDPNSERKNSIDTAILNRVEEMLYHGTKAFKVRCTECQKISLLQMDAGGVIIQPFRTDEEIIESRIRFGTTPPHQPSASGEDGLLGGVDTPQRTGESTG